MPLYKRKTLSRNSPSEASTDTSSLNIINALSKNVIELYRNSPETQQREKQEIRQTLSKKYEKTSLDSQFSVKTVESKQTLRQHSQRTKSKENNLSKQLIAKANNKKNKYMKKSKVEKQSSKAKSTLITKKLNRKTKLDFNNNISDDNKLKHKCNEPDTKFSKKQKKTSKHDISSEVDEMVISLWSQDVIPSAEPSTFNSHYEKLLWLQEQRNVGLYVCCDRCDKYRYLKDTVDPLELPDKWYCEMNPDEEHNKCSDPEVQLKSWQEANLIYNTYHTGSIVWAKLDGYPWWPAMVDDDPNTETYYWLDRYSCVPVWYHVVFFDSQTVSRAWLKPNALCSFKANLDNPKYQPLSHSKFKARLLFSQNQAKNAITLSVADRLKEYSFLSRWKGGICMPKDVEHNRKKIKRKGNYTKQKIRKELSATQDQSFENSIFRSPSSMELNTQKDLNSSTNYLSPELFEENEGILEKNILSWI